MDNHFSPSGMELYWNHDLVSLFLIGRGIISVGFLIVTILFVYLWQFRPSLVLPTWLRMEILFVAGTGAIAWAFGAINMFYTFYFQQLISLGIHTLAMLTLVISVSLAVVKWNK